MAKFGTLWTILLIAVVTVAGGTPSQAQATRTWVSGVGNDADPCSRTAPCKTFAGAISKTAAGGEIDALDPGGFGAVTITKAITIDGGPGVASILASATTGVVVAAGANDVVTIRNISINGTNQGISPGVDGIRMTSAGSLHLEHDTIFGFNTAGVNIKAASPSTSPEIVLTDVSVHNNGNGNTGAGVWIQPNGVVARVTIMGSKISNNAFGVRADNTSIVAIKDCTITANTNSGVQASPTAGTTTIHVDDSLLAFNFNGLIAQGPGTATIFISNDTITSNVNRSLGTTGASASVVSFGNNNLSNNGVNTPPTSTTPPQ